MAHEQWADTLPLVPINHEERDFCSSRLHDDTSRSTGDHRSAAFVQDGYERQVGDEVDVQEEGNFLFGKASPSSEEPAIE
jgi:hypothetical protein